jgi:hypothetical protein
MKLGDFAQAISTRVWESVGRANWRPFKEAREYVRSLGLKSGEEWWNYTKSGKKPADIPTNTMAVYARDWAGMADWLGIPLSLYHRRTHRPFKEARAFVHGLGFKSENEWRDYAKSRQRPNDIPANPLSKYKNVGWAGWGDWLGNGRVGRGERRSFEEAREFVRGLGLKSNREWREYLRSGKKPADIPAGPDRIYFNDGWDGWGDWLGSGVVAAQQKQFRPFKDGRTFARRLGLKSTAEWFAYFRSHKRPADIPSNPNLEYAKTGWAGWGDWLGTGAVAARLRQYRSFEDARAFVRGLSLKSYEEWVDYCRSGKKPADIPSNVSRVYAKAGWAGFGDWLGTGTVATRLRQYRSFEDARAFVHGLGLKSVDEWRDYCRSGRRPPDIPSTPDQTYAEVGWAGYGDWLGYAPNTHPPERSQMAPGVTEGPTAPAN